MTPPKKLLILPGDGIGPEVTAQVWHIIDWMAKYLSVNFEVKESLVGGASYDAHKVAITDATMQDAMDADAVLLGAVGGPQWDNVARQHRPETGLLRLRKEMDLFANLRPAVSFNALVASSTLKPEIIQNLDIMIVRELTGGVYFGQPRGIEDLPDGRRRGFDTQVYTDMEIIRVAKIAFELARSRNNKVHSVEKSNVMESGLFWRNVVTEIHAKAYSDVGLHHMYADNCAMQLVREPKQFDVILTDNLFGDLLSDCAAMLTGSLGMLPSASLSAVDDNGQRRAMYEPVHGSAPNIAGQNKANPLAAILSFAMALRYSFDMKEEAHMLEMAVDNILRGGLRTEDIMQPGMAKVSTDVMGESIIGELNKVTA